MRNLFFFDLDGTLEDSRVDMTECIVRVRKLFSLELRPANAFMDNVIKGMEYLYRTSFSELLPGDDLHATLSVENAKAVEKIKIAYEDDYLKHIADHTKLYPGIKDLLKSLADLGDISVITNKPEHLSRELLRKLDVLENIKVIMGGDSCEATKPSPLPLKLAASKILGDSQYRAFMVGDSAADIEVARRFGATSIWCAYGYLDKAPEPNADYRVNNPAEILAVIQKQLSGY